MGQAHWLIKTHMTSQRLEEVKPEVEQNMQTPHNLKTGAEIWTIALKQNRYAVIHYAAPPNSFYGSF